MYFSVELVTIFSQITKKKFNVLRLSVEYGTEEVWGQSFDVKTALLPWATGSVSKGNLSNPAIP